MARFSDRMGITKPSTAIQRDSMDDALRNSLWNLLSFLDGGGWSPLLHRWSVVELRVAYDSVPWTDVTKSRTWMRNYFFAGQVRGLQPDRVRDRAHLGH